MSFNATFKTYEQVLNYLHEVDYPQCFTVNYRPNENDYELWIGNQPYYIYEQWIEEVEQKVKELKKENLILKLKLKTNDQL
jgi:hypothetical protein